MHRQENTENVPEGRRDRRGGVPGYSHGLGTTTLGGRKGQPRERLKRSQIPPSINFSHAFWLGWGVITQENTGLLLGFHSSALVVLIAMPLAGDLSPQGADFSISGAAGRCGQSFLGRPTIRLFYLQLEASKPGSKCRLFQALSSDVNPGNDLLPVHIQLSSQKKKKKSPLFFCSCS